MKAAIRLFTAALFVVPVVAADPPGFALWRATELAQRDQLLSKRVGGDHSARETLADYGDHRFRLLYRDADGLPEQHDQIIDVVVVQSGEGTLLLDHERVDELLRRRAVDLGRLAGAPEDAVAPRVVDVGVEPVLVRGMALAAELRPEVAAARA